MVVCLVFFHPSGLLLFFSAFAMENADVISYGHFTPDKCIFAMNDLGPLIWRFIPYTATRQTPDRPAGFFSAGFLLWVVCCVLGGSRGLCVCGLFDCCFSV